MFILFIPSQYRCHTFNPSCFPGNWPHARGTCLEVERGAAGFDLSSSGLCETRLGVWVSWVRYCHFSWPSVQPGRYTIRWEGGLDRVVWGVIGFRRKTMEGGNLNRQSGSEWFSL